MADKVTLADLMEEQRTLGGPPALPNVMPREMRQPVLGQSNLVDTALSSFGRPSLEALRMGYEGKATPQEIARTFLETGPVGPFGMARVPNPIRAYHGSPHDFDEFRLDRIGTGEGAQAYGHGLYFAEAEPVARSYRDNVINRAEPTIYWEPADSAWFISDYRNSDPNIAGMSFGSRQQAERFLARRGLSEASGGPGRMYEVNLHARPEQFLDWDAPLSQQSEWVSRALAPLRSGLADRQRQAVRVGDATWPTLRASREHFDIDMTGREFLTTHSRGLYGIRDEGYESGSRLLSEAGIPGIRYRDQLSRDPTTIDPTSNYVVFNPEIIEILRKYGIIAPPVGMGAAAAMSGDAQQ